MVSIGVLLAFLLVSSVFDRVTYRIPNWWIGLGLTFGMLLKLPGGPVPVLGFAVRSLGAATLFFLLFRCRAMGAADIKLIAILCGWLDFYSGLHAVFFAFLLGAFWSLVRLIRLKLLKQRLLYFFAYVRQVYLTRELSVYYDGDRDGYSVVIPFAVCLFLGTFFYTTIYPS